MPKYMHVYTHIQAPEAAAAGQWYIISHICVLTLHTGLQIMPWSNTPALANIQSPKLNSAGSTHNKKYFTCLKVAYGICSKASLN